MKVIRSIATAFALFSKLPMPSLDWMEDNMLYLPAAFPLVGILTGLLLQVWFWLGQYLLLGHMLCSVGLTLIPIAVTGGIHLDGLCDTADALASRAPAEKKAEILADPGIGAFALISLIAYMFAYLALASEWPAGERAILTLGLIHMLSRVMVGFGLVYFPAARSEGFYYTIQVSARKGPVSVVLGLWLILAAVGLFWTSGWPGLVLVGLALLLSLFIYRMSAKQFGGMNGDLAGYWLQVTELVLMAGLVFIGKAAAL
ncbi:MAG: adenosylcobinamide-GDP ribazoletransferase [Clostridiaceae bacterium]|nr:adenosylcobinamide-GDP ribazoletransferase [Clostridiaceae bacterium]